MLKREGESDRAPQMHVLLRGHHRKHTKAIILTSRNRFVKVDSYEGKIPEPRSPEPEALHHPVHVCWVCWIKSLLAWVQPTNKWASTEYVKYKMGCILAIMSFYVKNSYSWRVISSFCIPNPLTMISYQSKQFYYSIVCWLTGKL